MITYTVKVYPNGTKEWFVDGKRHREDGPAIELPNGTKEWYVDGKCHREDGPAIELPNGDKHWYIDGKYVSKEEHSRLTKQSCDGKVVEIDGVKYILRKE